MPEAVHAILIDVPTAASEFGELLAGAEAGAISLGEACKVPPISRELSTFYTFLLDQVSRGQDGGFRCSIRGCAGCQSEALEPYSGRTRRRRDVGYLVQNGKPRIDYIFAIPPRVSTKVHQCAVRPLQGVIASGGRHHQILVAWDSVTDPLKRTIVDSESSCSCGYLYRKTRCN